MHHGGADRLDVAGQQPAAMHDPGQAPDQPLHAEDRWRGGERRRLHVQQQGDQRPSRLDVPPIERRMGTDKGRIPVADRDTPLSKEAYAYRVWFNNAWRGYLIAAFACPYAVSRAFGVDPKTARDWWAGRNAPSGAFVALVFARDPDRAGRLLTMAPHLRLVFCSARGGAA